MRFVHFLTTLLYEAALILFSEVSLDDMRKEHYRLLDTLEIAGVREPHFVTIGYCYKEGLHEDRSKASLKERKVCISGTSSGPGKLIPELAGSRS